MRMTTIIATLQLWVRSLWPFARNAASPASPVTSHPVTQSLSSTSGDALPGLDQPQAGKAREPPGARDRPSNNQPESGPLDDEPRPTELETASVETSSGSDPPEQASHPPDRYDDRQHAVPETGKKTDSGESDGSAEHNTGTEKSRNPKCGPRQIGGRRGRQANHRKPERGRSPSYRPELVCRNIPTSACWEVILTADKEYRRATVHLEGTPLDFTGQRCLIPSLTGRLVVSSEAFTPAVREPCRGSKTGLRAGRNRRESAKKIVTPNQ